MFFATIERCIIAKYPKIRDAVLDELSKISETSNNDMIGEIIDHNIGEQCNDLECIDLCNTDQEIINKIFANDSFAKRLITTRKHFGIPSEDYICAGNWHFSSYEEAETELVSHIAFQKDLVPIELMSHFDIKMLGKDVLKTLKNKIKKEVSSIICDFCLPIGYDIFVVACVLNPFAIEDNLSITKNAGNKAKVVKTDDNSITVTYFKNIDRRELDKTQEVIAAFTGYDIPISEVSKKDSNETFRMIEDYNNGMPIVDIARKYRPNMCKGKSGGDSDVRAASDLVRKRIKRFQQRKI